MKIIDKTLFIQGGLVLLLSIALFIIKSYNSALHEDLVHCNATFSKISNISSNKTFYEFATKHLFFKEGIKFSKFLKTNAKKHFITHFKFSHSEPLLVGKLKKTMYEIEGLSWHDTFIFELVNSILNFAPGFTRITFISIDKFSKPNSKNPALKMRILCELYSSQ